MDDEVKAQIAQLASRLMEEAVGSGLSWDKAVVAFGLAAKAASQAAASANDGKEDECIALGRERLEEGYSQEVRIMMPETGSKDPMWDVEDNPLLATAHRRALAKLH